MSGIDPEAPVPTNPPPTTALPKEKPLTNSTQIGEESSETDKLRHKVETTDPEVAELKVEAEKIEKETKELQESLQNEESFDEKAEKQFELEQALNNTADLAVYIETEADKTMQTLKDKIQERSEIIQEKKASSLSKINQLQTQHQDFVDQHQEKLKEFANHLLNKKPAEEGTNSANTADLITEEHKLMDLMTEATKNRYQTELDKQNQNQNKENMANAMKKRIEDEKERAKQLKQNMKEAISKRIEKQQAEIEAKEAELILVEQELEKTELKIEVEAAFLKEEIVLQEAEKIKKQKLIDEGLEEVTKNQKKADKLQALLKKQKSNAREIVEHQLAEKSDNKWHSTIMIGVFMLILGYVFPKFAEEHYAKIQEVLMSLTKQFLKAKQE